MTITLGVSLVLDCTATVRAQQDHATPQEVVQKVRQASQAIAAQHETALATYRSKNDTAVWKDSYVFVLSCPDGGVASVAANPVRPELKGKPLAQVVTYGPKPGEQLAAEFCAQGRKPQGGWLEYNFPRAGATQPERKVSYMLAVQGTPYEVGAGVYDATAKIDDLDKLSGGQP